MSVDRTGLRILWLAPYAPWPPDHGGKIRLWNVVAGLARLGHDVTLLCPAGVSHEKAAMPRVHGLRLTFLRTRQRAGAVNKLRSLLSAMPEHSWEAFDAAGARTYLGGKSVYDLVVLEQAHMAPYARYLPRNMPIVLIAQNLEHELVGQLGRRLPRKRARVRYRLEAAKFRRLERRIFGRADLTVAMSHEDRRRIEALQARANVEVHPNGVDTNYHAYSTLAERTPHRLIMTGTLGYPPNADAAFWLADEILPRVREKVPDAELLLVGGACPPALSARHDPSAGLRVIGYVDDVRPYVRSSSVFVMPLRMGGGTRLKALEAMASGTPIVSTSLGVEGIRLGDDPVVLMADSAEALAASCVELLLNPHEASRLAHGARQLVETNYAWPALVQALSRSLEAVVDGVRDE